MKKRLTQFTAFLCLMALICAAAQAGESTEPTSGFQNVFKEAAYQQDIEITPLTDSNTPISVSEGKYPGAAKMDFVYKQPQQGSEYVLFVLTDTNPPTADNIAYIDQKTADSSDGTVSFTIYPKKLGETVTSVDYTAYLSSNTDASAGTGITAYTKVASFSYYAAASVMLGDVNGNGRVQANDALLALRMGLKIIPEEQQTEKQKAAADVDKNGRINAVDARKILQVSLGLATF